MWFYGVHAYTLIYLIQCQLLWCPGRVFYTFKGKFFSNGFTFEEKSGRGRRMTLAYQALIAAVERKPDPTLRIFRGGIVAHYLTFPKHLTLPGMVRKMQKWIWIPNDLTDDQRFRYDIWHELFVFHKSKLFPDRKMTVDGK